MNWIGMDISGSPPISTFVAPAVGIMIMSVGVPPVPPPPSPPAGGLLLPHAVKSPPARRRPRALRVSVDVIDNSPFLSEARRFRRRVPDEYYYNPALGRAITLTIS
jgi:hypothetical protein